MNSCFLRSTATLLAGVSFAATTTAQTYISDNFEADSSADYFLVDDGNLDSTRTFLFDYVAAGIPLAPRSAAGSVHGLRCTANDSFGAVNGWTLYHNTIVDADQYRLQVDVYCAFQGAAGTTEHAHIGVGSDGTTYNQLFSPISGDGAFIGFDGDGGSISDFRWFRDAANTPMGETDNTTLPNDHPSYLGNGSNNTGSFFQGLFPAPPSTIAGSPGNVWTTLTIEVDNLVGVISFYFDDVLTFQGDFDGRFDGHCSLGMADLFASISPATNFVLYDNFIVTDLNTPTTLGTNYCTANANSTGVAGVMSGMGSVFSADNDVTLTASNLPIGQFGIFVTSMVAGSTPVGSGNLCLSGSIGRYTAPSQILQANANGQFSLALDLTLTPQGPGFVPINAGETWHFQAWHRDITGGTPTSNFTDGYRIDFQ